MSPPPYNPNSPSLTAVLSNLTSLLHVSTTSLTSLPIPKSQTPTPRHPSPLPLTLQTVSPPPSLSATSSSDVTISLNDYVRYDTNFFYRNCPGPVTITPFSFHPLPLLNLPNVLYIECDSNNFIEFDNDNDNGVGLIKFLPSEVWSIRSEVEAWGNGNCPNVYSFRVLRAVIRLRDDKLLSLKEWIVVHSCKYGVSIDFEMCEYVMLLVKLCLKAVVREAFGFKEKSDRSFECPSLVRVVMWLGLQFGILYGEVNGKCFAVDVLKECVIESAKNGSLFRLEEEKDVELNEVGKVEKEVEGGEKDEGVCLEDQTVGRSTILISQVALAVAALHERAMIEEKIKALRNPRAVPAYQRNMEHAYVSKMADEERQKRSDNRPIIEHDGLLWQRSNHQDTGKPKTREELLAEERDYKRRRMSYRGKKMKRNTLEVMRNIIDEYMEEIRQAGGISGLTDSVEETQPLASETFYTNASATTVSETSRNSKMSEENKDCSHDYKKKAKSHHDLEDSELHWNHGLRNPNRNVNWARHESHNRDDHYRKRDVRQSGSHSRDVETSIEGSSNRSYKNRSESNEQNHHKRYRDERERTDHKRERDEHDDHERERDDHERNSRRRERSEDKREHRGGGRSKTHGERYEDSNRHRERRRSKTNSSGSSRPELDEFEDRYDPAESHDL